MRSWHSVNFSGEAAPPRLAMHGSPGNRLSSTATRKVTRKITRIIWANFFTTTFMRSSHASASNSLRRPVAVTTRPREALALPAAPDEFSGVLEELLSGSGLPRRLDVQEARVEDGLGGLAVLQRKSVEPVHVVLGDVGPHHPVGPDVLDL